MASIHKNDSTGIYSVHFRFGKQFKRSLRTKSKETDQVHATRVEETIRLVRSGGIEIPDMADIAEFIMSDGKLEVSPNSRWHQFDDLYINWILGSEATIDFCLQRRIVSQAKRSGVDCQGISGRRDRFSSMAGRPNELFNEWARNCQRRF